MYCFVTRLANIKIPFYSRDDAAHPGRILLFGDHLFHPVTLRYLNAVSMKMPSDFSTLHFSHRHGANGAHSLSTAH